MKEVMCKNESHRAELARVIIGTAGNKLASVHFRKRSDGSKRRMSFRLHVQKPTFAKAPGSGKKAKKADDTNLLKVFDVNKIEYTPKGYMTRGAYRTIPLEMVERICVNGEIYKLRLK